jgi:uncharacterized membrane protein (DUF4010 family)
MNTTDLFYRFGVALFIGMLIGLQREHAHDLESAEKGETTKIPAGVRTFSLLAVTGCLAAFIADLFTEPLIFLGILFSITLLLLSSYYFIAQKGKVGLTSEVAAVVTLLVGALCFWGQMAIAVAIGVVMTALLSFKFELHRFAERITRDDMVATLKFAIITAIILPVLPNQSFWGPPFDVLNPYKIWLMVVLISGLSFLGYILMQMVGSRQGIGLTGILGGLVSSTAVTLTFSQRSHQETAFAKSFALAIIISWVMMFGRVLVEVGAVYSPLLRTVWLPITAAGAAGLLYGVYLFFGPRPDEDSSVEVTNPFELGPAITFGLLYGVILLVSRVAQIYFGSTGVYLSSILSGLADVDAITLSMSELNRNGSLDAATAARAIVLAAMSNTVVKGGIVLSAGTRLLRRTMLPGFLLVLITGVSLAFLL